MNKEPLSLLLLSCLYNLPTTDTAFRVPCETGWISSNFSGTCLKLVKQRKSWDDARILCQKNYTADLVKIVDSVMNDLIANTWQSHRYTFSIGLIKEQQEYQWLEETKQASYLNWDQGQPIDFGRTCANMNGQSSAFGKWTTAQCTYPQHFVCEKSPVTLCPTGWTANPGAGTCFKVSDVNLSWPAARGMCQQQGAELVIIDTDVMSLFLWDQVSARPGISYWIGLNERGGKFHWLDYKEAVTYTDWFQGQPKNWPGVDCGALHVTVNRSNGWYSADCSHTKNFICEKYSGCVNAQYGMFCPKECSPHCVGTNFPCNRRTAVCLAGCESGYKGPMCGEVCDTGTYGMSCSQSCSFNCGGKSGACDHTSGICLHGCVSGYDGVFCDQMCVNQTYGENCLARCSQHCAGPDSDCSPTNGSCTYGCETGYIGEFCERKKPNVPNTGDLLWVAFLVLVIMTAIVCGFVLLVSLIAATKRKSSAPARESFSSTYASTFTVQTEVSASGKSYGGISSRSRMSQLFGSAMGRTSVYTESSAGSEKTASRSSVSYW